MTVTIEVEDDKALEELKEFLENRKEIRLVQDKQNIINAGQPEFPPQKDITDEDRRATLNSLYGSLSMSPERFKEYETFLQEIRNEWK